MESAFVETFRLAANIVLKGGIMEGTPYRVTAPETENTKFGTLTSVWGKESKISTKYNIKCDNYLLHSRHKANSDRLSNLHAKMRKSGLYVRIRIA